MPGSLIRTTCQVVQRQDGKCMTVGGGWLAMYSIYHAQADSGVLVRARTRFIGRSGRPRRPHWPFAHLRWHRYGLSVLFLVMST